MISDLDKVRLANIFGQMTIAQIMTYTKYFSPPPIVRETIRMKVRSLDGIKIEIWGKNVDEICDSIERYKKVDAILG